MATRKVLISLWRVRRQLGNRSQEPLVQVEKEDSGLEGRN